MSKIKNMTFATSATALLFLIMAISGVMMFFHLYDDYVKEMHEYLGFAFIAIVLLHLYIHFKSFKSHMAKPLFHTLGAITAAVALIFILNTQERPNPKRVIIDTVLEAPLQNSLTLFGVEKGSAMQKLEANGIQVQMTKSIATLAKEKNISPFEIVRLITQEK